MLAHTIASWKFSDGQHLAISIETRKEQGESCSAAPYAEMQRRSDITSAAPAAASDQDFSARIHEGLPARPR